MRVIRIMSALLVSSGEFDRKKFAEVEPSASAQFLEGCVIVLLKHIFQESLEKDESGLLDSLLLKNHGRKNSSSSGSARLSSAAEVKSDAYDALQSAMRRASVKSSSLMSENIRLKAANVELKLRNTDLNNELNLVLRENGDFKAEVENLRLDNANLRAIARKTRQLSAQNHPEVRGEESSLKSPRNDRRSSGREKRYVFPVSLANSSVFKCNFFPRSFLSSGSKSSKSPFAAATEALHHPNNSGRFEKIDEETQDFSPTNSLASLEEDDNEEEDGAKNGPLSREVEEKSSQMQRLRDELIKAKQQQSSCLQELIKKDG